MNELVLLGLGLIAIYFVVSGDLTNGLLALIALLLLPEKKK
jgi:hypothetical protein